MLFMTISIVLVGREIEPIWGTRKIVRCVLLLCISGSTVSYIFSYMRYRQNGNLVDLSSKSYGSSGILSVMLLGMKQERSNVRLPFGIQFVRCGDLVSVGLAISVIFGILGWMPDVWFVLAGTMICWFDLRYFCPDKAGLVGDATETFAFATFFPKIAQPHVSRFTSFLSRRLGKLCGCVHKSNARRGKSSRGTNRGGIEENNDEAMLISERRRQRALKALDAKLKEIEALDEEPLDDWETLDEAAAGGDEKV